MQDAALTSKGQTTIPKNIRDGLGIKAGDKMTFALLPDGVVILRAKTRSLNDVAGVLEGGGVKVSVEQMSPYK